MCQRSNYMLCPSCLPSRPVQLHWHFRLSTFAGFFRIFIYQKKKNGYENIASFATAYKTAYIGAVSANDEKERKQNKTTKNADEFFQCFSRQTHSTQVRKLYIQIRPPLHAIVVVVVVVVFVVVVYVKQANALHAG